MKKMTIQLLIVIAFTIVAASCKKNSDSTTPTNSTTVVGFWGGTGVANGATQQVGIVFKSDGKMRFYGGANASVAADTAALPAANKSDGTYTASGTTITGSYVTSGVLLLLAGTLNATYTTIGGTAGISPATTGVGTFNLTKQ